MIYLSTFLLALFISMALIPLCSRAAIALRVMDLPGGRKMHDHPIPRTGGLAIAIGATVPVLLWCPPCALVNPLLAGAGLIVLFGVMDDVRNMGYRAKFCGQIAAALIVIVGGVRIRTLGGLLPGDPALPLYVSVPLTLVVIVGVTNAVNLADGLDGLAGGISALSFGCIGYLAYLGDDLPAALAAWAVAGAVFGFLRFNNHPATVFMGDAGSQFLGFMAVTLALALTQSGTNAVSPMLPLLLVGFPVLDTVAVMATRVRQGRSPFYADKNHFHHKLLRVGLYHADAVRVIYLIQAVLVTAAIALRYHSDWLIAGSYLVFCALVLGGLWLSIERGWKLGQHLEWKSVFKSAKTSNAAIRFAFRGLVAAVPGTFLFSCLVPESVPKELALLFAALAGALVTIWITDRGHLTQAVRLAVYLTVPLVLYLGNLHTDFWVWGVSARAYNLWFLALAFGALAVVKLTRRQAFRSTPMDLLVLVIALAAAGLKMGDQSAGMLAARIIVLFFGYEVILSELRGSVKWVGASALAALGILVARSMM